jgi:hypothetical protein
MGDNGKVLESSQRLVTPLPTKVKSDWDKECVKWMAQSCRPLSMGENDKAFRQFINTITYGRYKPPFEATAHSLLCDIVADLRNALERMIDTYQAEGLMVSICADIWGEDGKSLYGVLVYFITSDFVMQEKLILAKPFSDVAHVWQEIEKATKQCLAGYGIGQYDPASKLDSVGDEVHGSTTDEGSNIKKAFKDFEGAPCTCHQLQNALKHSMKGDFMQTLERKVRGIVAHFRRSNKGFQKLLELDGSVTRPNGGSKTRWGGIINVFQWIGINEAVLKRYVEPENCAVNEDGTTFSTHILTDVEFLCCHQLVSASLALLTILYLPPGL